MNNNFEQEWQGLSKQEKELMKQWTQSIERKDVLMSKWPKTEFGTDEMGALLNELAEESKLETEIMAKLEKIDKQQFALIEKERKVKR
ncbi:MAG: hypothetical protein WCO35_01630 [Candidatus Nomurabacteria bacterium]